MLLQGRERDREKVHPENGVKLRSLIEAFCFLIFTAKDLHCEELTEPFLYGLEISITHVLCLPMGKKKRIFLRLFAGEEDYLFIMVITVICTQARHAQHPSFVSHIIKNLFFALPYEHGVCVYACVLTHYALEFWQGERSSWGENLYHTFLPATCECLSKSCLILILGVASN